MFKLFSSSRFPTFFNVLQRAHPSYNPRGTCPRWAEPPAAPRWTKLLSQQFLSKREGGVDEGRSRSLSCIRRHFCFFLVILFFSSHFLTFSRSCNRQFPLIIKEGGAHAGQYVQPLQEGQYSDLNSSLAHGNGKN
jgi:hypothetical protein